MGKQNRAWKVLHVGNDAVPLIINNVNTETEVLVV